MISFQFRSPRIEHELIMSVGLQDIRTGAPVPGLLTATIINFSVRGASMILPTLTLNGKHLFYETLNSDRYNLLLYPEGPKSGDDASTIAARSIWMDSCEHLQQSAFKVGLQFLHDQNTIYQIMKTGH